MTEHNDHDLGERFHALRREDADTAPTFHATLAAARARATAPRLGRRALGLSAAAVAAAAVGVAGVALLLARPDRQITVDLATVRWEAPTDFLLHVPGDELLRTVPELGRVTLGTGFTTINSNRRTP
jgi:hypothetical protein